MNEFENESEAPAKILNVVNSTGLKTLPVYTETLSLQR